MTSSAFLGLCEIFCERAMTAVVKTGAARKVSLADMVCEIETPIGAWQENISCQDAR